MDFAAAIHPVPVLKTERLILRGLVRADAHDLFLMRSDPRMIEHTDQTVDRSIDDTHRYLDRMLDGGVRASWIVWAIETADRRRVVGSVSLWNFTEDHACAELGYGIHPSFWGLGYMRETLRAVLSFAFGTLGMQAVEAYTERANLRSSSLLGHLGFRLARCVEETGAAVDRVFTMDVFRIENDSRFRLGVLTEASPATASPEPQNYRNGQPVFRIEGDESTYFYQSGALKARGPFNDGRMEGEWRFYRETGQLAQIGHFRAGIKDGLWIRFDRSGAIEYEETFRAGKLMHRP